MEESQPISPHVVRKVNLTFDAVSAALTEAIKSADKKKSFRDTKSEKRNQALRNLLYFSPGFYVCQSILPFLSHSDKITQRLAYYHLNWITEKHLENQSTMANVIQAELGAKAIGRRLHCLRTFSHLIPSDGPACRELMKYIETILEPIQSVGKKDTRKLNKDSGLTVVTRQILQYASLLAMRQLELGHIPESVFPHIITVIELCEFPVAVRHAFGLLQSFAHDPYTNGRVVEEVRKFMPSAPPALSVKSKVLGEDVMARIYMVRTFAVFSVIENLSQENSQFANEYYEALGHMVWDISPRVGFEAIHKLASLGWDRLKSSVITFRDGFEYLQFVEETSVLNRVLQRLVAEITEYKIKTKKSQCILHAAIRAIIELGKTRVAAESHHKEDDSLSILIQPLNSLLENCQEIIRQKVLTALIWILHCNQTDCIMNIFVKQLQLDVIPKEMFYDLLRSLHERVILSPTLSEFALRFIFVLVTRRPSKAPFKPVAQLWTSIIKVSREGKPLVQEHIFKVLDYPYSLENRIAVNEIYRLGYYVLSREALNLTRRDKITPRLDLPYVRSIILRLEHAAINSTWEVRNICIDGLAKVAFVTPGVDIRKQILGFFCTHNIQEWNPFILQIIDTLQLIVQTQEKWITFSENSDGKKLSSEDAKRLSAENQKLLDQASAFCTLSCKFLRSNKIRYLTLQPSK